MSREPWVSPPGEGMVSRQVVSPQVAADMLDVDRDTVLRWIKNGRLRASKISPRIVRIPVADIDQLLEERKL